MASFFLLVTPFHNAVEPAAGHLLADLDARATGRPVHSLYGDGRAAPRMARLLAEIPSRSRPLAKRFFEGEAEFAAPWQQEAA